MATSRKPFCDLALLGNPIWNALSTSHSRFAEGDDLAKRYLRDVAPLSGISQQTDASYDALGGLVRPDESVALFLQLPPRIPGNWTLERTFGVHQMIRDAERFDADNSQQADFRQLTEQDVPGMLALTRLTEPGPFRKRTIELGTYLGIFSAQGSLVAMSGERLRIPGFTEISAVCAHPEYRGKGYARFLMSVLLSRINDREEIPFLHVKADNVSAIKLYESLGFSVRTTFHLALIKKHAA